MKVLIFGGTGGMGTMIQNLLDQNPTYDVVALGSEDADVAKISAVEAVLSTHNPDVVLNFAVHNADGSLHKLNPEQVEKQLDVNVNGAVNVMSASIRHLRNKDFGRIIFLSSVLSTNPVFGTSIYSAAKGFVDNLVKTAALENVKYGITVNSIQLGYFEAGLIKQVPEDVLDGIIENIPLKRLGRAEELLNAIEFLINTEYMTGVNLPLSGGLNISSL